MPPLAGAVYLSGVVRTQQQSGSRQKVYAMNAQVALALFRVPLEAHVTTYILLSMQLRNARELQ